MSTEMEAIILWLEGRAEYHLAHDFLEHLNAPAKSGLPIWYEVLSKGSQHHIEKLLNIIFDLPESYQRTVLNLSLKSGEKLSYFVVQRAAPPCFKILLNVIATFSSHDKWDIFSSQSINRENAFIESVLKNPFNGTFQLLIDELEALPIESQLSLLKQVNREGENFLTVIAKTKVAESYGDFLIFIYYFSGLLDKFYQCHPPVSKEEIYRALFKTEKEVKLFYQTALKSQSVSTIYYLVEQGVVPSRHMKYLTDVRETLWQYITALPVDKQLVILSDLQKRQSLFSPFFSDYGATLNCLERLRWRMRIENRYTLLFKQVDETLPSLSSYSRMHEQLLPVVAEIVTETPNNVTILPQQTCDKGLSSREDNNDWYDVPLHYPEPSAPSL